MPSNIWTRCAGSSEIRPLSAEAWRVVEAQHQIATRKLVDTDEEQVLLEEILEQHKPPLTVGPGLHYLLFTPFRYPPLPHGSRFGARHERGIWYGSEVLRTAFAEVAFYRLLFLEGTEADLGLVQTDLSAFSVRVRTRRGIDLTMPPFGRWRSLLASKTTYHATQPLGADMRTANVEAFRYASARDVAGGVNVGVFAPRAFAGRRPRRIETWHCRATKALVELSKRDYFARSVHRFPRPDFLVRGELPNPAA
jgi:RES domain-containing protein